MPAAYHDAGPRPAQDVAPPYPASWMDRLVDRVAGLPGPAWALYLPAFLLFAVLNNAVFWLDGTLAAGTFDLLRTTDALYVVYGLAFYHYLRLVAAQALDAFRPALDAGSAADAGLRYRLTVLPARWGWVALLMGAGIAAMTVQTAPGLYGIGPETSLAAILYQNLNAAFSYACIWALAVQTIRQLRLVNLLHRRAESIDLFHLAPFRAFSRLTARAGIALVLVGLYNGLLRAGDITAVFVVLDVVVGLLAAITFLAPLMGIRARLQAEKGRLLAELNQRLKSILGEANRRVDDRELAGLGDLNTAVDTLLKQQAILRGISTWPWDPGTVRGFGSTLVLPVLLWLITRFLERLF